MIWKNFLSDALCQPCTYRNYFVSRKLTEMFPARRIVEGADYDFKIEAYAAEKNCFIVEESGIYTQTETEYDAGDKTLTGVIRHGWLNVLWRGALLDVVLLSTSDERAFWIIADEQSTAEDFLRAVCESCAEVRGEILVFEQGYWQKDKQLFQAIKDASFDDLVLPAAFRRELEIDLKQFFAAREMYERLRAPWKRGVLFIGSPGNGKTQTIKALINSLAKPCLYVKSFKARFESDHTTMRTVFARARTAAPCLLVFEDLDSLVTERNRSFFLNELDGFAENTGVVVIASTNHPEKLDSSILDRPSRFDRKFYFQLPAYAERLAYLKKWSAQLAAEMILSDDAADFCARETNGFSFAYLKEATLSAIMQWINAPGLSQTMDDVLSERIRVLRAQMTKPKTARKQSASSVACKDDEGEDDDDDDGDEQVFSEVI